MRNFQEHLFSWNTSGATCEKLKAEGVFRRCSVKKVFLEISLNSQENTCIRASFLQLQACNFIKIENFVSTFLRTPFFLQNTTSGGCFCKSLQLYTKIRLCHWCFFVNFLKIFGTLFWWAARKNVRKKSLCRWLFRENYNTINCDDNHDAICSLILRRLLLLGSPCNEISLEVRERSICVAARPFYLD